MPNDVPVATVAVNGAHNAGILAVEMLAINDKELKEKLIELEKMNTDKVRQQNQSLNTKK
jgi:5-(carboxyamino)imidazole ribonucleotide mutase